MCSNAGFMLAFCPRRLFNIIIFMQFSKKFGHHKKITKKAAQKKEYDEWMRKNDVHLFFEQRLSVTSEISFDDTIFHEQNAVVFRGCVFSVGVVFNRHHAFVERTKFRIQSRANESRN